ncbi:class I SAM-dependent methyltransferase [Flavobacteriales bacterium]|nr:class I SAM-dependent methyltransferase [Flavobacteriales bacterium]
MITLDSCPACKGKKFVKKLDCKDHSTSKEQFTIVSCETCSFIFTNPRPSDKDLEKYYISDMYISHTNQKSGVFNWLYQTIRKHAINRKVRLLKKITTKKTHLDIGCGTGDFLNACKKEGFVTKGIEPSELARNQAINNFQLDVSENTDLSQFRSASFESISMWHVLEHVSNINDTIAQFSRVLKKGGIVIVAVPNCNAWDATYYKEFWAAWDVPIHLWHFSKKTIEHLFKNHGFTLVKTKPMIFDSFYVSLLSEEFKFGKKKFVKSFLIGLYSNFIGLFSNKGHSSIIYVFKREN